LNCNRKEIYLPIEFQGAIKILDDPLIEIEIVYDAVAAVSKSGCEY
jgi:hypothetical protein